MMNECSKAWALKSSLSFKESLISEEYLGFEKKLKALLYELLVE